MNRAALSMGDRIAGGSAFALLIIMFRQRDQDRRPRAADPGGQGLLLAESERRPRAGHRRSAPVTGLRSAGRSWPGSVQVITKKGSER